MKKHASISVPAKSIWVRLFPAMVIVLSLFLLLRVNPALSAGTIPLGTLLQPDGTLDLDSGVRGSIDPAGFAMATRKDGTPIFTALTGAVVTDEDWQGVFGIAGANGDVRAVVMDGSGNLYIGGNFTSVCGVAANRVAMWNGSTWSALGSGMNGEVRALALDGSILYAGGAFSTAGGNVTNAIAKWNSGTWSGLDSGMSRGGSTPYVLALAIDESGNVFAAGWFDSAGGTTAKNIARWNGSSWSCLGTPPSDGVDNIAYSLYWDGSLLYVGGTFTHAGTVAVGYIAAWTGFSWQALGSGSSPGMEYPGGVYAIIKDSSGVLYAGGGFTGVGSVGAYVPVSYVAKFTGGVWSAVGSGINGYVSSLQVDSSDNLYAGGGFSSPEGLILKWNGAVWSGLGSGYSGVYSFVLDDTENIYAGGGFTTAGGNPASKIAYWNGSNWSAMSSGGMNQYVNVLALDGAGNLYAGGNFTTAGKIQANRIAMWNGTSWSALGSGISDGQIYALACDSGGNVYAGGSFTVGGGSPGDYIAQWNGSAWSSMGTIYSPVYSLLVDGTDTLFAGTYFGGIWSVVRWTGTSWANLPGLYADVLALAMDSSGNLYAGGKFTGGVAMWDGVSSWSTLDGGIVDGQVNALVFDSEDNLYAGGTFTIGGGSPADYLARWDGAGWSALGGGVNGPVMSLGVDKADNIYAGGSFTTAGGISASNIAKWNGSSWSALGSGTNNQVYAMVVNGKTGDLYAGGMFTTAGTKDSRYIGWLTGLPTGLSGSFPWPLFYPAIIIK